ncbi:MAG TPA: glycoside hydrolase family 57 protein [Syntrophorhabdaceae bacterium]|nr:glycoside hydrolase family 57 protein [Syntrophorhabdaceae bacterium]
MDGIYISFLWHMHQPYYKNSWTGKYLLPWVLLHGTKDYYDMASMLKDFPGMKQNFNFVPSLLEQLVDYENLDVKDTYLDVFRKHPEDLTDKDKVFLLTNFFNANWDNMIRPFPRYYELLGKRGFYYPKDAIGKIIGYFSDDEIRDIQMLFYLAWIDPVFFKTYEGLQYLGKKGRAFSEEDKSILQDVQKDILKGIIPLYRDLSSRGIVEMSTSPFYHPIIPLLIDNKAAREAMPGVNLPDRLFAWPEDASRQISAGAKLFENIFGSRPEGMWPPEGSVSDEALQLYMEQGVKWLATDEDILFESLKWGARRDGGGWLINPEVLFKPYRYEKKDNHICVVFRDQSLSDLISFHYQRMDPRDAAQDCLGRLRKIRDSVKGKIKKPLVTIAMDGENAWEGYRNDGRDFLSYLYEGILRDSTMKSVTISEYLKTAEDYGSLYHCFAGSWIGHNFGIWIGHNEDNIGWSLLTQTRKILEKEDPEHTNKMAWESVYIAEGSDWFWWYGDEHSSESDEIFDLLFRENLANVYRYLGKEVPEILSIPIITKEREARPTREPVNFLKPVIDGRVTNYFEWIGSGFIEGKGHGSAMHDAVSLIKGCYYGFNETNLFLRLDLDKRFMEDLQEFSFEIALIGKKERKVHFHVRDGSVESDVPAEVAFGDILELAVSFDSLGVAKKEKVDIWISLKMNEMIIDRMPQRGYLVVTAPSETFEAEMWYV